MSLPTINVKIHIYLFYFTKSGNEGLVGVVYTRIVSISIKMYLHFLCLRTHANELTYTRKISQATRLHRYLTHPLLPRTSNIEAETRRNTLLHLESAQSNRIYGK